MKIAIPQLNYHAGDLAKNSELIQQAIGRAKKEKADLIVFPELSLCGSFPHDLLEREHFIEESRLVIEKIASTCTGIAAVIGAPNLDKEYGFLYDSAYFIKDGEVCDGVHKSILSDCDIYEDSRYFVDGSSDIGENNPIRYQGKIIRVLFDEYEAEFIEQEDDIVLFIQTSPFTVAATKERQTFLSSVAKEMRKDVIYVGRSGAETSFIFDGNSMVFNRNGRLVAKLREFSDDFQVVDVDAIDKLPIIENRATDEIEQMHKALVAGLKDYFYKNKFTKAVVGLSGGIDSALVAALAVEAIGKENVLGVLMPSEFSTDHSVKDAQELATNLGIEHHIIPIKSVYSQYIDTLHPLFHSQPFNVAEENLQARIRGTLLFAISNKFGHIVLNTSNKSEAAVGYGTLYGDLCGSLCVIGDMLKTKVYLLAHYINKVYKTNANNANKELIPTHILTKAPSAELHPGQKDQDALPEYAILDKIVEGYVENNLSEHEIVAQNVDTDGKLNKEVVAHVVRLIEKSEYKRAQCPPALKLTKKTFGCGRRMGF
ncbi:NAD+ synthase [Bacteroidia bacterium]|nr:NAD+ synthase [Bacteroidia bacterium]